MPTAEERAEYGIGEGVPVLWVVQPDGVARAYAADQWRIRPALTFHQTDTCTYLRSVSTPTAGHRVLGS